MYALLIKFYFPELIVRKLDRIAVDMNRLDKKMDRLMVEHIRSTEAFSTFTDFVTKYELVLPFQSNEDFEKFDKKLEKEREFKEDFVSICINISK